MWWIIGAVAYLVVLVAIVLFFMETKKRVSVLNIGHEYAGGVSFRPNRKPTVSETVEVMNKYFKLPAKQSRRTKCQKKSV